MHWWTGAREAYYDRDLDKEKFDRSCWKPWRAIRERQRSPLSVYVTRDAVSISLERAFDAPGTAASASGSRYMRTRRRLKSSSKSTSWLIPDPEGIYFAIPLNLGAGWRAHFDTAGQPVELDAEQLPGACRNWFTVESFAAIHSPSAGRPCSAPMRRWRWPVDSTSGHRWRSSRPAIPPARVAAE